SDDNDRNIRMNLRTKRSRDLLQRALKKIPGAVNSPVRAWSAVKGATLFIAHSSGAYVFDADGNRFIDYVGSYGPAILGHSDPRVSEAGRGPGEKRFQCAAGSAGLPQR